MTLDIAGLQGGDAIVVGELSDDGLRFVDCNARAVAMFGRPRQEIIGSSPLDLSPPTQPNGRTSADEFQRLRRALLAGEAQVFRWRHLRPDGSSFDAELSLGTIAGPDTVQVVAVVRDLGEREQIEARLLAAQRLEALGSLAGGIAHNLNTILAPIMLAVERLRPRVDDPSAQRRLDVIADSAERAAALIRQIVTFAQGSEAESRVIDPASVIRKVAGIVTATFPRAVKLEVEIADDLYDVRIAPAELEQVLLSLCLNARDAIADATGDGLAAGTLTIAAANYDLERKRSADPAHQGPRRWVRIAIRDSGVGMDRETLVHAFDPFFTTKAPGRGTGLGLSTAYTLISGRGGTLHLESQPGAGTEATILLPAAS